MNNTGEIAKKLATTPVNWYSSPNDYSGFQAVIKEGEELSLLKKGEIYYLAIEVYGDIIYITGQENLLASTNNCVMGVGKNGDITLEMKVSPTKMVKILVR